jgi:mannose-6-phosphate isomerase-like protein (cupin superfamily)
MDPDDRPGAVRVPANPVEATVEFLERFGFRLEEIAPADDPAEALMTGRGLRLRLERDFRGPVELVVPAGDGLVEGRHLAPGGLVIEVVTPQEPSDPRPAPAFVHTRLAEAPFHEGRAGLFYRDLVPSRMDGRWIASHICAATGGPVKDRVHHHAVRLQLIYCLSGEAQLVYEEQGPPFTVRAGDLVLQPPGLRHQVLSASAGFEVVEIASPAWHPTSVDHDMLLPSPARAPDRLRQGQRFLHAVEERCQPETVARGVEARDLGLHVASGGLASARVLHFREAGSVKLREARDLEFLFVRAGAGWIDGAGKADLETGDALALPPGPFALAGSPGLKVLEVTVSSVAPRTC